MNLIVCTPRQVLAKSSVPAIHAHISAFFLLCLLTVEAFRFKCNLLCQVYCFTVLRDGIGMTYLLYIK